MQLLLLSNSTLPGEAFFHWPADHVSAFLNGRKRLAFVPLAAVPGQQPDYVTKVRSVFAAMDVELVPLMGEGDMDALLAGCDAVAVGGGNTFHLLRSLYRNGLVRSIAQRVRNGMPYLGWSAGSNVACPTIMTTNDMPVVEPPSLRAMHLVPFQINPHYTEATIAGHGGESRDQRLSEFLEVNPAMPVVGLREGSLLHVVDQRTSLIGRDMKLFRHGRPPLIVENGSTFRTDLTDLKNE
ncbi:MAG TPA: dipeptidase PepE [Flavobacteriales bacterium]|jgi:dipeptidase E|nr:dipeptidase PepE [Flavobacteriales bacterium]HOZ41626.1 dipeptidase PepE [Flavobacteriales bacterium]